MTYAAYAQRNFSSYYVDDDKDISKTMDSVYNEVSAITQQRWYQQSLDERYYSGDSTLWDEVYSAMPASRRKQFSFNKIRSIINMPAGYQRQNRKALECIAIENSDEETSNQFSKILRWANNFNNMTFIVSEAFLGSLITGMNLLSIWVDHRTDPISGDIKLDNLGYSGYVIDPYFRQKDLSDCQYVWTRKYLPTETAAALMPKRANEIKKMRVKGSRDSLFNYQPQQYELPVRNLLPWDEFWYLCNRSATMLIDYQTEEMQEWKGDSENLNLFLMQYPQIKVKKMQIPSVKLAIRINGVVMYHGANPYKIDKYPFVPVICYHQPDLINSDGRIQGMVRDLRDPQFLLNRRSRIMLDILESQINSGLKVMEDSLVNDKDAFKSGQGQVMYIKKEAPLGLDSVQKIPPGELSAGTIQVIEMLNNSLREISGVNEELLGSAEDDKAGILSMLRQGAGLTTIQIPFDNLDYAMKLLGNIELDLIQANATPAKVERIIEQKPTPQFYNRSFQKYDCVVVEGANTPTQRMTAFKQKLYLRELGIPIPTEDLIADASFQNKAETLQKIAQAEDQQKQAQMMQMQVTLEELKARAELSRARAAADYGLKDERESRVYSNMALAHERRAESIKDLEQATLDKVKAIKELQGIDLTHLQQAVDIINSLREKEAEQANMETPKEALGDSETKESSDGSDGMV